MNSHSKKRKTHILINICIYFHVNSEQGNGTKKNHFHHLMSKTKITLQEDSISFFFNLFILVGG